MYAYTYVHIYIYTYVETHLYQAWERSRDSRAAGFKAESIHGTWPQLLLPTFIKGTRIVI